MCTENEAHTTASGYNRHNTYIHTILHAAVDYGGSCFAISLHML